jgi:hypothetical protein
MNEIRKDPCCTISESIAVFSFLDLLGSLMRFDFEDETKADLPKILNLQQAATGTTTLCFANWTTPSTNPGLQV